MTADDFVDMHRKRLPVKALCEAIGLRRSTYYAHRKKPGSARMRRDADLAREIALVRRGYSKNIGRRNVAYALRRKGKPAAEKRIGRVMKANGWYGVPYSRRSRPALPVPISHRDLVQRQFSANEPNRLWWGDTKEFWTGEGKLYLASLQDAYSRYIVGFALSATNDTELTKAALSRAVSSRRPGRGLIHHTDRGGTYTAWGYQTQLENIGALPSVSRPGVPHDNACIESFHSTLQREFLAFNRFATRQQGISQVSAWIRNYNLKRFHSTLGYLSPAEHESHNAA